MRWLVVALLFTGCLDSAADVRLDDVEPPRGVAQEGLFHIVNGALEPATSLRGLSIHKVGERTTYTMDWLEGLEVDRVGMFFLEVVGPVEVLQETYVETPIYTPVGGEGAQQSAVCLTQQAWPGVDRSFLSILLGGAGEALDYPMISFGGGGYAVGEPGWSMATEWTVGAGHMMFVAGGVSGMTRTDLEDGDVMRTTWTVDAPHRLIRAEDIVAFCDNQYRFESLPATVPAMVIEGSTFTLDARHGAFACFDDRGGFQGMEPEGSGEIRIGGETIALGPGAHEVHAKVGPSTASVTVESWRGYFSWALVDWPSVAWCTDH